MQTDRMISGLPHAGNSEPSLTPLNNISGMKDAHEKSPESFANLVEHALKKQDKQVEERTPKHSRSAAEGGPRKDENPSVKQEVKTGARREEPKVRTSKNNEVNSAQKSKAEGDHKAHEEPEQSHEAEGSQIKKVHGGKKTNLQSTDRQQVMQEFMDSMESKFGTPPTRLVEAMTKLDALDQLRTPEETASQVIDKLDLSPADAERAEAMYVSMLQKLSTPDQFVPDRMLAPSAETAAYAQMSMEKGLLAQRALEPSTTKDEQMAIQLRMQALQAQMGGGPSARTSDLQQQLANVSGDFFEAPVAATTADDAEFNSPEASADKLSAGGLDAKSKFATQDSYGIAIPAAMKAKAQMAAADYREIAASAAGANAATGSAEDAAVANGLRAKLAALQSALTGETAVNTTAANTATSSATTVDLQNNASLAALAGKSASSHSGSGNSDAGDSEADHGSSQGGASSNSGSPLLNPGQANQQQDSGFALAGATGAQTGHISANKEVQEQTLQQVINSAKYIMKKGGGESIVKLTPEGLGSLHLKVAVADGKVNVQMTTASKEAKEMLEGSMKDLKSSLGAHSLKVEHIKVDVGNQTSSEGGSANKDSGGFKFDHGADGGRDQARQAMQNFHDENSANRGFMGRPDQSRAYAKASSTKSIESAAPASRPVSRGDGRGSGLNLVA